MSKKNHLTRAWLRLLLPFVALILGTGCRERDIYPTEPQSIEVRVTSIGIDSHWEPFVPAGGRGTADYDFRFTIDVYAQGATARTDRRVVTSPQPGQSSYAVDLRFDLPAGQYTFVIWADYVTRGTTTDLYYTTDDLTRVRPIGTYTGSNDWRDAFSLSQALDLSSVSGSVQQSFTLARPFARYEIVANDLEQYIAKTGMPFDRLPDIRTEVGYQGYFPYGYNALEARPNDAAAGVRYTSQAGYLSDTEALLAFDYVWVNGGSSSVKIDLVVRDHDDAGVHVFRGITIPYARGRKTVVEGKFLTTGSGSGGINVNPGYEGEINVVLNN